ncbi:9619_t:CDS:2, partial [Dentiscutata erythropus]
MSDPIPGLNIIVPLATIFSILDAVCLIYLLMRILTLWWITKRSLVMVHRVPFYFVFGGDACKIIGGITFFLFTFNVSLSGSVSLTIYLRICREIVIDLGIYDYKLFLPIILISLIITLIGFNNYGHNQFWCFSSPTEPITALIAVSSIVIILIFTIYCYIMTLLGVYSNRKRFSSKLSQIDFIVARKITFYVLIVILEWVPVIENFWIYTAATLSVSFGGIGNTILYIIYENWRNSYNSQAASDSFIE